ncbi:SDR family oxidoreductase [Mucilaginibacter ginsenosidivorans]|uniref:SDR family oxidoreductase n=1 Tax=Mucilaginibacter ginsenosidivorans TaxID=398053 RepID=A0A5B8UVQ8_9SPHI|nr:SDR family oxidoreductase [Mucilaginibacter ginsenosidivorans]QEC62999.1 SDR family oxidoreductase [Mucilaginibacter ginsenosidivorans]
MTNALITAATKGMGRATAIALAKDGISLAICARNQQELEAFKLELLEMNPYIQVMTQAVDGSQKEQLLSFATNAEKELGFISVIVNNLGMFDPVSILDESDEAFDKQLNTNLMPAYHLYKFFGKKMIAKRKGHIFTICSVAALDPIAAAGTYSVTKVALLGLTKVMRAEMQPHGVKVTAIIPGSTLTNSWAGTAISEDKFILPEDIASAIVNTYKMSAGANVDEIIIRPVTGQV